MRTTKALILMLMLVTLAACQLKPPFGVGLAPVSSPLSVAISEVDKQPASQSLPVIETSDQEGWEEFSHEDLPRFNFRYPQSWSMSITPFEDVSMPSLELNDFLIRLSSDDIELSLGLYLAMDDNLGFRCSNTVEFTKLPQQWTRITDQEGTFYSPITVFQRTIDDRSNYPWSVQESWEYEVGETYDICDYREGIVLKMPPRQSNFQDYFILLIKPRLHGTPSPEILAEADAIVTSIVGIEGRPDWLDD